MVSHIKFHIVLSFHFILIWNCSKSENKTGSPHHTCSLEFLGATETGEETLHKLNLACSNTDNGTVYPLEHSRIDNLRYSSNVNCSGAVVDIESGFAKRRRSDFDDRIRINCSSFQPLDYKQDMELPFARTDVLFSKQIMPDNQILHEVSARFPKTLGIKDEGLPAYSGTYTFWSESGNWSYPISLNISTPRARMNRVLVSTATSLKPGGALEDLQSTMQVAIDISANEAICQTNRSKSYVYFANIGGANNPTEASLLKYCLNMSLENNCGNKYAGTNCNLDRKCKKISPIHQNGMVRCSIGNEFSEDKEYFRDINAEIQENMRKIWEEDLVVKIEKEDYSAKFHVQHADEYDDEYVISADGMTGEQVSIEPTNITLYDLQMAQFECHFIHYVLVPPVLWYIGWSNGTQSRVFVDNGDNITEEIRYIKTDLPNKKFEEVRVRIKSSHYQFQVALGMVAIKCELWYWNSTERAANVQPLVVKESRQPMFSNDHVRHMQSAGEALKLECMEYNSTPYSDYNWEFEGEPLHGKGIRREPVNDSQRHASFLEIPKAGKSDGGVYTCTAYNFRGEAKKTFEVTVDDSGNGLLLGLSITSVFLIFSLVVALAGLYEFYLKQRSRLSRIEIKEFLTGNAAHVDAGEYAHINAKHLAYDNKYELSWNTFQLEQQQELGKGVHGVVYKGKIGKEAIAVKTVREGVAKEVLKALLEELKIMIYLGPHEFIVELKGACTQFLQEGRAYVLVEFCSLGSIESFLRNNRHYFIANSPSNDYVNGCALKGQGEVIGHQFNRYDMIQWSVQIAKGMQFLEEKKVIHGDLAIRNILLKSLHHAKITDFGLSRQLINTNAYVKTQQGLLPWRNMAIEALRDFTFTSKSDVWSYGVTLWEIFTLGTTPYPGMNWTPEIIQLLEDDLRLYKPKHATDALYKILTDCWNPEPERRPSFQEIEMQFSKYMAHL